jgi:hypothetical protein
MTPAVFRRPDAGASRTTRPRLSRLAATWPGLVVALAVLWGPDRPTRVVVQVREEAFAPWQLFVDRGNGFHEADSSTAMPGEPDGQGWRRLRFALPQGPMRSLRLDPPAQGGALHLGSLCVGSWLAWRPHACLEARQVAGSWLGGNQLEGPAIEGGALTLRARGLDPQLVSGALPAEFAQAGSRRPLDAVVAGLAASLLGVGVSRFSRSALRRLRRTLGWLAWSVAGAWVGAEAVLFVVEPWSSFATFRYDRELGFVVRPRPGVTDPFGFPERAHGLARSPGTFRVLLLSDSFNWMGQPSWNYTTLLERGLRALPDSLPRSVEIVAAGYPMTSAPQQLQLLRRYGWQYRPDLVLLGVYAGNDFVEADPGVRRIVVGDLYVELDASVPLHHLFDRPLLPRSRVVLGWEQFFRIREAVMGEDEAFSLDEHEYLSVERRNVSPWHEELGRSEPALRGGVAFEQAVATMAAEVRSRGVRFAVAAYPAVWSVDEREAARVLGTWPMDPATFDLEAGHRRLAALASRLGVPYLDLLPGFREAAGSRRLYLKNDVHWNRSGNELAARLLLPFVAELARDPGVVR